MNKNETKDSREVFFCDCGHTEHMLVVSYYFWGPSFPAEFFLQPHLATHTFLKRLAYAWRYLWGRQSRHGAFDCILLNRNDVVRLRDSCDRFLTIEEDEQ